MADINKKAERSESMVREITAEIKQLDCAKWNLTAAITALNHLHMLAGGAASLRTLAEKRQYKELVLPLQAIMEVRIVSLSLAPFQLSILTYLLKLTSDSPSLCSG